ncbi:MAG: hypothetical protein ACQGVC_20080 [Myxococcota bacterium]
MRRHGWLLALGTALCVLQVPLCALACVEAPAQAPVAAMPDASHAAHPCHEPASADPPAGHPADDPGSHADCGCEVVADALLARASHPAPPPLALASAPAFDRVPVAPAPRLLRVAFEADLPPPDVLRLTSTLRL